MLVLSCTRRDKVRKGARSVGKRGREGARLRRNKKLRKREFDLSGSIASSWVG